MIKFSRFTACVCAAVLALALAGAAHAASQLGLDFNSLTAQAQDSGGNNTAFGGVTHTGKVVLSKGGAGVLAGVNVDGSPSPSFVAPTLTSFTGTILLNNGQVTGGSMLATITNPDTSVDTYTFSLVPGSGNVTDPSTIGIQYFIAGLTSNGAFNDGNFSGVPIPDFGGNVLTGTFFQFKFAPGATSGLDTIVDLDVTVNAAAAPNPIPLPAAVWGGIVLFGGLIGRKVLRRKQQA